MRTGNHIIDGDNGTHPSSPYYESQYRYYCDDCNHEFDNPDADELCPKCLSNNWFNS